MAKQKPAVYTTDQQWFEAIFDELVALKKEVAAMRGGAGAAQPAVEVKCARCGRSFNSDKALLVHRRTCKGA